MPTSLENQALTQPAPNGVRNQQQTSNFLQALNQAHAGSNNSFMSSGPTQQAPTQQMLGNNYNLYSGSNGTNTFTQPQPVNYDQAPKPLGIQMLNYQTESQAGPATQTINQNTQGVVNPIQWQNQVGQLNNGQIPVQNGQIPESTWGAPAQGNVQQPLPAYSQIPTQQGQVYQYNGGNAQQPAYGTNYGYSSMPVAQYYGMNGNFGGNYGYGNGLNTGIVTSDETAKTNIEPAGYQVQSFLDTIKAHSYEYKDASNGVGRFVGPMAQELEKTDIGKSAVIDTPQGKKVDTGRLNMIQLAALSDLHQRMKTMEQKYLKLKAGK